MAKDTDGREMREMCLLKRNAYKAVDDALQKCKKDESISVKEMEGLRDEVEPLLGSFVQCVLKYLKVRRGQ